MKEVMAVIRMNMINKTKKALALKEFNSLTCCKVHGRGRKKVNYELISRLIDDEEIQSELAVGDKIGSSEVVESLSEGHRLIPKRLLTIIVEDEAVEEVVKTIIDVNQTGNPGDGKIFVLPVSDAVRVRTGERAEEAI